MVQRAIGRFFDWMLGSEIYQENGPPREGGCETALALFDELEVIAQRVDRKTFAFYQQGPDPIGFAQLHRVGNEVLLHRIWTTDRRRGWGTIILRQLCELADRHEVVIRLKVLPLGNKPYPMSVEQLRSWYHRNGFSGEKKMVRLPVRKVSHA